MSQRDVKPKEIIFREGEIGDCAYVLKSGKVEILKHAPHGEVPLAVLEKGAVFGEMALFDTSQKRSATARALEAAVVVDTLSAEDFQMLLAKCPGELLPFLYSLIDRLRSQNQRLAAVERATVLLDAAFETIAVQPASPALQAVPPVTVKVATLPFTIGGYLKDKEHKKTNDLDLPSAGPPQVISEKHCRIERQEDGVFLVDAGSRFGTIVNGQEIGRGKVSFKAPLVPGDNTVTLGGPDSPYTLKLVCA